MVYVYLFVIQSYLSQIYILCRMQCRQHSPLAYYIMCSVHLNSKHSPTLLVFPFQVMSIFETMSYGTTVKYFHYNFIQYYMQRTFGCGVSLPTTFWWLCYLRNKYNALLHWVKEFGFDMSSVMKKYWALEHVINPLWSFTLQDSSK